MSFFSLGLTLFFGGCVADGGFCVVSSVTLRLIVSVSIEVELG